MNGYHFYIKSISMGYLFHPKSIWMGKIWKIVYEWGQFSKIVYEWGQFSIWEVYEWVMFFTWPGIWMGWGSGTPAAHPYPKSWQVTPHPPPPPPRGYGVKGLVTRNTHVKSLPLTVHSLWPRLKFVKNRSNFKVKFTRLKIMVWRERSSQEIHMWNMKALPLTVH